MINRDLDHFISTSMHISTLDANIIMPMTSFDFFDSAEAIGTGKVATPDQAEETQAAIRAYMKEAVSAEVADKVPW